MKTKEQKRINSHRNRLYQAALFVSFLATLLLNGCAKPPVAKVMEATAYCGCSSCCSWERGSWQLLKLDFWNRYVSAGPDAGRAYSGLTARGTVPYEPEEGLLSMDSVYRPWMIPVRLVLFPWYLLPREGTIAADTKYYPFGTHMYVPGYGWGVVEDRGGAIKGPNRIDLYYNSHDDARAWGRKKVRVIVEYPR
ncbi:MAG: 3D domain-containing protein [Desulforhopalus sp.]